MKLTRNAWAVLGIAFCVFTVSSLSLSWGSAKYTEWKVTHFADNIASFDDLRDRFGAYAREHGALAAFQMLRDVPLPAHTDIHLLGHEVGDILYDQQGVPGMQHCTQEFRNACSHSIVIGALGDFGEGALEMIREACKKAPGGEGAYTMCYHGLGHGVFAYNAYDLTVTNSVCKNTGAEEYNDREYIECMGGTIMELMGGGGHDRKGWEEARKKYLSQKDPIGVCLRKEIPNAVRDICVIYLTPFIWENVGIDLGNPDPALFPKAFSYCTSSRLTKQLRASCMEGFGKEFIGLALHQDYRSVNRLGDEEFMNMHAWCMSAPQPLDQASCLRGVASSLFWGGENDPKIAFRFCAISPNNSQKDACYTVIKDAIITFVTNDERRAILCSQLPSSVEKEQCTAGDGLE